MTRLLRALEAKYTAQMEEALAVIDLYLNKSVGVGDHENITETLDKHVAVLESANSKLRTLQQLFANQGAEQVQQQEVSAPQE